jgi:PAS domain S-box-containing protein
MDSNDLEEILNRELEIERREDQEDKRTKKVERRSSLNYNKTKEEEEKKLKRIKMDKPLPTQKEITLSDKEPIFSKTDSKGKITYSNAYFQKVSGYSESELLGAPHSIVRHPDMPKAIFFFMWKKLKDGKSLRAIVKNMSKSGDHYWVITEFTIDKLNGNIIYTAKRTPAPRKLIEHFEPVYRQMVELEELAVTQEKGMEKSLDYLTNILTKADKDYDTYIDDIVKEFSVTGFFKKLFS